MSGSQMELPPKIRAILAACANRHLVTVTALRETGKGSAAVTAARREAARELRALYPPLSLPQIGRYIGKHHTSVIHLLRMNARELARYEPEAPIAVPDDSGAWAI